MQISDGMKQAYVDYAQSVIVSKQVETFNNPHFGEIRTAVDDYGEPWFCLADICKALDLTAKGVRQRLDDEVISNYPITDTLGREQQAIFVNEDGLYDAILDSRKPEARAYRKWITGEVLPSIRKTGSYSVAQLSRKELALMVVQAEEEKERLMIENKAQADKIAEDAPKVEFHDNIVASSDTCLVRELAKILTQRGFKIGQNRLYEILRNEGYLVKSGADYNQPTHQYVERGLFEIDRKPWTDPKGQQHIGKTSKVTPNGIKYFVRKFLGKAAVL